MDKGSLKFFATESRKDLLEKMKNKLAVFGITSKGIKELEEKQKMGNKIEINGTLYPKKSYDSLCSRYKVLGYEQLLEESAYTWFNRLVAFAFMEINNYIDERIVFNNGDRIEPEILDNYYEFDFFQELDEESQNEINDLKEKNRVDSLEKLYSILVEEKCYELSKIMPFMFEKRGSYSDILFPDGVLARGSFLEKLRDEFRKAIEKNEEDEEVVPVEIIGWLYQYYNSDLKDEVFADLKKNKKITKEKIAPATQLFTPHWIVKYMGENSLGKLALESCGVSEEIKENWKYYIENEIQKSEERLKIEEIKIIDPAMGSGHMLTYCFDMLSDIYENLGWSKKDAVLSIIKNNIYGLDIDKRASQLASFAIFMKAREKFSRFFKVLERMEEDEKISINTLVIEESNDISESIQNLIKENSLIHLEKLLVDFYDAKEYGSILKLESIETKELYRELKELEEIYRKQGQLSLNYSIVENIDFEKEYEFIEKLIYQYRIMIDKYDIVITNPPYMGGKGFDDKLKKYVEKNYKDSKGDLFAVFIEKCNEFTKENRYTAMITMHSWMFLSSFENLRKQIIEKREIQSLNHLGTRAFEELGGEVVQTVSWVGKNKVPEKKGTYIRLVDYNNAQWKEEEFLNNKNYYSANQKEFEKIPGSPIAYWVSNRVREIFEKNQKLGEIAQPRKGNSTSDNNRFLRLWFEVEKNNFKLNSINLKEDSLKIKWFPYNKGGGFRKYYGNNEYLINWLNDAEEIRKIPTAVIANYDFFTKEGLTWSTVSSAKLSVRNFGEGFIFDNGGCCLFSEKDIKYILLGLLNSKVFTILFGNISPTLNFQSGDIAKIPIIIEKDEIKKNNINEITQQNINIAKEEWDSRETSWDFKKLFITKGDSIEKAYDDYCQYWSDKFMQMHHNEEELNRIFIDIYELNDEMDEKVPFEDITLLKKEIKIEDGKILFNKEEIIKQFLSYAVGCIMGRYSIDKEELIIANSDDILQCNESQVIIKDREGNIRHSIENSRFLPDEFGIIPVTGENVFENDIVSRVFEFVKALYGEKNFDENIRFICEALGQKEGETYDEVLRNYFIKDFYTDHLQRYQKRPIYWFMNSGKKNGFSALIYLHRYEDMSIARVRTEYLIPYQEKMENLRNYYEKIAENPDTSSKDRKIADKKLKELYAILKELQTYANDVKHISELKISLDLDDGVKVNYEKFGKVLKKI
ncbi:BREX-1 system adenine-specific DNA-methyltransferase PglX [uncultured Fusobacterium sp.]|jgi:type II restriction/modification system DNA methylase subunit YeeA|uniref:BREX-1 system adenine-specific DNA-methyltransferase PglX n=1 Tax=uncultured Fusobacterium sp. TaxID=159267 RepID=UPI0025F6AA6C|nr:BREX-1 system adenine-specific DNA-methyltransferase PglX [uncultured Fusobacterium sp.]